MDFECFINKRLHPLYQAHYALWVYWWPLWRQLYSKRHIMQKWQEGNLMHEGQTILDYGCGTGSFTIPAARIVGEKGKVYALDCFPRQLEIVEEKSKKEGLDNVHTILSENGTGLPDASVDVVWMCDVLHEIHEREAVLSEVHRVMRQGGTLAIYDGMRDRVLDYTAGLFSLTMHDGKLHRFVK